ncbi:MAG TPA: hypothetical protein VF850_00695 [Gemmatimonadaceae bacterium]
MSETARFDLVVPLERLEKAILSDLLWQSNCEEVDRPLSEGGTVYCEANGRISSGWTSVNDAVSVWTRNLRDAGYYPETVLAAEKPALRQAAGSLVSEWALDNMIREAGQACIAAYFDLSPSDLKTLSRRPLVSVPRGTFTPGSTESEPSRNKNSDRGQHTEPASLAFLHSECEVAKRIVEGRQDLVATY